MQDIFSLNLLPIQTAIMSESTIFIYNKGVIIFGKVECSDLKCFPHYYLIRCVENILTRPQAKVLWKGAPSSTDGRLGSGLLGSARKTMKLECSCTTNSYFSVRFPMQYLQCLVSLFRVQRGRYEREPKGLV